MVNCEFLLHDTKSTCAGCRGWFCTSISRKKLSNISVCTDEEAWPECPRYLKAHPELAKEAEDKELFPEIAEAGQYPEKTEKAAAVKAKTKKAKPKKKAVALLIKSKKVAPVALPTIVIPPSTDCPYLGPIPAGEHGCCDYWCYANDAPLRTVKRCKSPPSWRECRRRYDAERAGVKHART